MTRRVVLGLAALVLALAAVPVGAQTDPFNDGIFDWPVGQEIDDVDLFAGDAFYITQNYHNMDGPVIDGVETCGRPHAGADISWSENNVLAADKTVYAAANGTVECTQRGNYPGWVVVLRHVLPDGAIVYTQYGHLTQNSFPGAFEDGTVVNRGDEIGTIHDQTNNSHLHFEIRTFPYWNYTDKRPSLVATEGDKNIQCGGRGYAEEPDPNPESPGTFIYRRLDPGYLDPTEFILGHRPPLPERAVVRPGGPLEVRDRPTEVNTTRLTDLQAGTEMTPLTLVRDTQYVCGATCTRADYACGNCNRIQGTPAPCSDACSGGACDWWYQVEYGPANDRRRGYVKAYETKTTGYLQYTQPQNTKSDGRESLFLISELQAAADPWSDPDDPLLIDYVFSSATNDNRDFANTGSESLMIAQIRGAVSTFQVGDDHVEINGTQAYLEVARSDRLLSQDGFGLEIVAQRRSHANTDVLAGQWGTTNATKRWLLTFAPAAYDPNHLDDLDELHFRVRLEDGTEKVARFALPDCIDIAPRRACLTDDELPQTAEGPYVRIGATYSPNDGLRLYWDGRQVAHEALDGVRIAGGRSRLRLGGFTTTADDPQRLHGRIRSFRFWGEAPPPLPDLDPISISVPPAYVLVPARLGVRIRNIAQGTSGSCVVRLVIDNVPVDHIPVPELAPGDWVDVYRDWTFFQQGTHLILFQADPDNQVEEALESNNVIASSLYVGFAPLPDLHPSKLNAAATMVLGNSAVLEATLVNQGQAESGSWDLTLTADGAEIPGSAAFTAAATQPSLPPGESVTIQRLWTPTAAGTYTIEVTADSNGGVQEENEGNNVRTKTVQVVEEPQPDLRPTAILYTPADVYPGNVVRFDSGVRNDGTVASPDFNIRWLVDGQDVGATGRHLGVPARSTLKNDNSEFYWTVLPGRHTIAFLLDYDHQVPESNEVNNRATVAVGDGPITDVDLATTAITYDRGQLYDGNYVDFDSGVANHGSEASGSFRVRWIVDGVPVGPFTHGSVGPGSTVLHGNSSFRWQVTAGRHLLQFEVDSDNAIAEPQEGNNLRQLALDVPGLPRPDLDPDNVLIAPAIYRVNDAVTLGAVVRNRGTGDAGPFQVVWQVDNRVVRRETFASLAANGTLTSQATWTAEEGVHSLSVFVDELHQVQEANETNNRSRRTVAPIGPVTLGTFPIPATHNVFGAGLSFTGAVGGGSLPQAIDLPPGTNRVLTFSITGSNLSCCGTSGPHGGDGGNNLSTYVSSTDTTSGVRHLSRNIFLLGVFLDDDPPTGTAPALKVYYEPGDTPSPPAGAVSTRLPEYPAPSLRQSFFIGDGAALAGIPALPTLQRFRVPDGATRLFLGFADGLNLGDPRFTTPSPAVPGFYGDNTGQITVTVRALP